MIPFFLAGQGAVVSTSPSPRTLYVLPRLIPRLPPVPVDAQLRAVGFSLHRRFYPPGPGRPGGGVDLTGTLPAFP